MTGRFDKYFHYHFLILFPKIQILVFQYYVRISHYTAVASMYFTERSKWEGIRALITM